LTNMNSDNYTGFLKGGKKKIKGGKKTNYGTHKKRVGGRHGAGKRIKRKGAQKGGMYNMQPTGTAVSVSNYSNAMGGVFPMTPFGTALSNSAPVVVNPHNLNMGGFPNKLI